MGDGVENDDTGRRERASTEADGQRSAAASSDDPSATAEEDASADPTEVVEPLTLDDPTDEAAADTGEPARPTGGHPTGRKERSERRTKPDLELVEPVELDDTDDGLAAAPSSSGQTPPAPDATAPPGPPGGDGSATPPRPPGGDDTTAPPRPPGGEITSERLLTAFLGALRDDGVETQVADVRRELAVDRNQDVDERLKRLESAVGDQDLDARLQRVETAVKQLANHVSASDEQPTNPDADPSEIQDLRDGLDEVQSKLETIAALERKCASSIETLETRVEALCRWQETVSAVASGPSED